MNKAVTPQHIAIIMDGNRRWAKEKNLPTLAGHKAGGDAMKVLVEHAGNIGVKVLTVYAFSSENWERPALEVKGLMQFFKNRLTKEVPELHAKNVQLRFIGDKSKFSTSLQKTMREAEELTAKNTGLIFCPAMNYGSLEEVIAATQKLAKLAQNGDIKPEDIDLKMVSSCLYTQDLPNPDLLIRAGGESRLSNFLLLQSAYAELIFDNVLWPDYTPCHLDAAIEKFNSRNRRYGR